MKTMMSTATAALCALTVAGAATAQEILILAEDVPAGLNYDGPAAAIPSSQQGMVTLLEPLVGYADGETIDGVVVPDFDTFEGRLAESWEYDEDTLTWTFNLRQGVTGCGGATFNADDVIYTFERAKSVSGAAPIGWFLSNVASIDGFGPEVFGEDPAAKELGDSIVKIDDYTVQLRQAEPNALLLPVLTIFGLLIFDKETMEANATADDPWSHDYVNNTNAPGFGGYCIESWAKNEQITYTAYPDYYRGAPDATRVSVRRVPQSSNRLVVLRSGQADLVTGLTPREYNSIADTDGLTVAGVTGNENLFIHMNYDVEPFDNIALRRAIAHAIPFDQIIATGYFGEATQWNGMVPSTYPGYTESAGFTYDPDMARDLLAEAGYPNGEGLDAFAEAFALSYVAEKESTLGPIVNVIQTALREVGIPATLDPIPQTQYGDRQLVRRDLPFAVNDQEKPIGVDAGYAIQLFFVSPENGGLNNMVNYRNADLDAMWAEARVDPDTASRDATLAQIQDMLAADVTWLPVVEYRTQWAFNDRISGLKWYPDNSIRYTDLQVEE
ncbi:ABC transporter substrate-binding protein [Ponticoccus sp. SC2-23]|uniref:ABC transporter substrate-binding protein n=1 Tax=Alexandriicola marinus TaxID=2081710 RepID=UPI000FDA7F1E|nr:ABC transporter substrate-binding protein [Alexandriicola marinus]MBM1221414.1 ABC transporter substrate-binding protein [Ponticoccus sp. SC6-9]MBM1226455.1 ABC transporter substrate-binding protein [Ponticoccus sp. SC6-15]MBM1230406.1 ABC transporter substrate-binding protein [Ponticoccus sp. SC6-38]MBM1234929.1 ABC transporter substrate-binding protein [Ponticoccus sp. SC6-45]MBM1239427.1 ABC transporter substrate-binding protein [Ponticoccus sp. SC6-49]MBM1243209.1 ABC transporter subst